MLKCPFKLTFTKSRTDLTIKKSDNRFTSKSTWSKHFNNRTSSQRGIQNCRKSSQEDRTFQILIYCNQYPPIPLSTTFTHSSEIGKRRLSRQSAKILVSYWRSGNWKISSTNQCMLLLLSEMPYRQNRSLRLFLNSELTVKCIQNSQ